MTKSPLLIFMSILLSFLFPGGDTEAQGDYTGSPKSPSAYSRMCTQKAWLRNSLIHLADTPQTEGEPVETKVSGMS